MEFNELAIRDQIQVIQDLNLALPQVDIQTNHYLGGGVYEREVIVPEGTVITGKIHLSEHLAKLVKGTMTIFSENAKGTITGPVTFTSKPGDRRVGLAHDECVFSTFHTVGDETDIEKIEQMLVVDTEEQYRLHQDHREVLS